MEERKFVNLKKEEYNMKEYIKNELGKGKISSIKVEYTPVGEKITVGTTRPGFVIGRKGERINELTRVLKEKFSLENPHIEINEIEKPEFDAQYVADEIATGLEKAGSVKFKGIAYKMLNRVMKEGAMGVEIRLSGKLPSERSRTWRFNQGYLKKTGETSKVVDRALTKAITRQGSVGVHVSIMPPNAELFDKVDIEKEMGKVRENVEELVEEGVLDREEEGEEDEGDVDEKESGGDGEENEDENKSSEGEE